jgi:hypothetical protein
MARDMRDPLEVLRFELAFLQSGGYRSEGNRPHFFYDSVTCWNFGNPGLRKPCRNCLLADFIPELSHNERLACRSIPLDDDGNTIASLERRYNRAEVERAVSSWVGQTVARLERKCPQEEEVCQ